MIFKTPLHSHISWAQTTLSNWRKRFSVETGFHASVHFPLPSSLHSSLHSSSHSSTDPRYPSDNGFAKPRPRMPGRGRRPQGRSACSGGPSTQLVPPSQPGCRSRVWFGFLPVSGTNRFEKSSPWRAECYLVVGGQLSGRTRYVPFRVTEVDIAVMQSGGECPR